MGKFHVAQIFEFFMLVLHENKNCEISTSELKITLYCQFKTVQQTSVELCLLLALLHDR